MRGIKVAALQFDVKSGDKDANLSKVEELLGKIANQSVKIAAMSEYFLTGFPITRENVMKWAEPIPGKTTDRLAELAKRFRMCLLGSIIEREGERFHATCPVIDASGNIVGKHRKVNLWMMHPADELGAGLTSGETYSTFKVDVASIAILLGDDFAPEPARICALKGADMIFYLTAIDYPWIDAYRAIGMANAYANLSYVVSVNRAGVFDGLSYFGESRIINPMGEVIASAGSSYGAWIPEGVAIATLDLDWLHELRQQPWNPLKLRKPETYGPITKTSNQ